MISLSTLPEGSKAWGDKKTGRVNYFSIEVTDQDRQDMCQHYYTKGLCPIEGCNQEKP